MLIVDPLYRNDPPLRALSLTMLGAMGVLLAGLWWVQVVSARDYQARLETQSFRTVRLLPVRGKILDRNGVVLADSQPTYNLCLYLEELRAAFEAAYTAELARVRQQLEAQRAAHARQLNRRLTAQEQKQFALTAKDRGLLRQRVRYQVASNLVEQLSRQLQQPLVLEEAKFQRHYAEALVLPLPLLADLRPEQMARVIERPHPDAGVDIEVRPLRRYPFHTTAAHVLGQVRRDVNSVEGEDAFLNYPLPVLRGEVGIEAAFDAQLRGRAGSKSVLVNNLGYRESETVWTPVQPGQNVRLTLDLGIQQCAEKALQRAGATTRGAVVVMDPHSGDILALVSSPAYDPNVFVRGVSPEELQRLNDPKLRPQINRATQENYAPGSVFKIVTALACLEAGLDPHQKIYNPPSPSNPNRGCIQIGRRIIQDTAPPGEYDFHRGFIRSSNTYFVTNGLKAGIQNLLKMARRLHLGERTGLATRQETAGALPTPKQVSAHWHDGDTANVCFGQGPVAVTPLQMAIMTAAIANGGKVLWPRLVARLEMPAEGNGDSPVVFPPGRVRDELRVSPRSLEVLRQAMLGDTEDAEGTAYAAFRERSRNPTGINPWRVCGKTGTAQVTNDRNQVTDHIAWFVSFAPYERPRYVVVVMVEGGVSGGSTCAPIAREIYAGIAQREKQSPRPETLAQLR